MLAFHCSKNKNNSNFKIDKTNFVIVFLSLLNSNSNNSNKLLKVTMNGGSQLFSTECTMHSDVVELS